MTSKNGLDSPIPRPSDATNAFVRTRGEKNKGCRSVQEKRPHGQPGKARASAGRRRDQGEVGDVLWCEKHDGERLGVEEGRSGWLFLMVALRYEKLLLASNISHSAMRHCIK
jgi:hypothetical protein